MSILMFMRHWLAAMFDRERPALFRELPESYKIGHPLPRQPLGRPIFTIPACPTL
jgi:hypothetical protein